MSVIDSVKKKRKSCIVILVEFDPLTSGSAPPHSGIDYNY